MLGMRAVRWDASTTAATELPYPTPISGTLHSLATAINDAGTVVGYGELWDQSGIYVGGDAVRWDATTRLSDLKRLPQPTVSFARPCARSTTRVRQSGRSKNTSATKPATRHSRGFARCDGTLQLRRQRSSETRSENPGGGITDSNAYAINSAGFAVGYATWYGVGSLYGRHAVYWGGDGTAIDLNSFIDPNNGWLLTQAFAISDTGWIAGVGQFDPDGPGEQPSYPYHVLIHVPATAVPTLPGDFNRDGIVDAADYVVWRKGVGIAATRELQYIAHQLRPNSG